MTLSMTTPIMAGDIIDIKCYKALKVYLLRGTDGSEIVIKTDAVEGNQLKTAGQIIKALDPIAKMKILTPAEHQQLRDYCQYVDDLDAFFEDIRRMMGPGYVTPIDKQRDVCVDFKKALADTVRYNTPFAKMLKQTVHNIEDAVTARGEGSKDLMRQFVRALKNDGGLERLGGVIAGDLFIGNMDRFYPLNPKEVTIGPFTFSLRVTVNLGNVMLIATANGLEATALDYADPNSAFKLFTNRLAADEQANSQQNDAWKRQWQGRILGSKSLRHKFAGDVIHDLESLFNPKKSAFSLRTKLGRDAVSRLEKGMVRGTRTIYNAMNARPNKPAGLSDRLAIISNV